MSAIHDADAGSDDDDDDLVTETSLFRDVRFS
jgi:hypothetical protein